MWPDICQLPSLAQRVLDLKSLKISGAKHRFNGGKKLVYEIPLSPTAASRIYKCVLHLKAGDFLPEMIIVEPDLRKLAEGRDLPHIYPYSGAGVKLCLWLPKSHEWNASMRLSETYIPWTLRWLWYFEEWLYTDEWSGGGDHPNDIHRNHIS